MLRLLFPVLVVIGIGYYAIDYVNGGIERVTTQEAVSCLEEAGAHKVRVAERGVEATTKGRTADIVLGEVDQGDYTVPIMIAVLEDDYLPDGGTSSEGFAEERITNALIEWDAAANRPDHVVECLEAARLDR